MSKKLSYAIVICFTNQEKMLVNFMMIIPQWCLNHCINHSKEKDLKYWLLSRWLPIALPQVKAGDNSANLLNEIRQTAYSLYQQINQSINQSKSNNKKTKKKYAIK